jgi:hypothetical protein
VPGRHNLQGKTRARGCGCRTSTDYPTPAYRWYGDPVTIPADISDLVGKACNLCRVYIYSNSRVLGYGRPTGPTRQPEGVLFKKKKSVSKDVFQKGDTGGVDAQGA